MVFFCIGLGPKTRLHEIMILQIKLIGIALRLPVTTSVIGKFKEMNIRTVYEYHIYEILKFSLSQIRNGFKILNIGTENRQTRNRSLNIWNFAVGVDKVESRAIILMNALRTT